MSVLGWFPFVTADRPEHSNAVADPGGDPGVAPSLILDQTEELKLNKADRVNSKCPFKRVVRLYGGAC